MGFAFGYDLLTSDEPSYGGDAARQERLRQQRIKEGTAAIDKAFAGYNDAFYKNRAQAYYDYALPELGKQYREAQAQTGFNLTNRGLQKSQAANRDWSQLYQTEQGARRGIADTGLAQAQALRSQVEQSRNNLISLLYQSADPSQASAQAVSTAAGFSYPSVMQPLANQFGSITNAAYMAALLNAYRQPTYAAPGNALSGSGMANIPPPSASVTVGQ